MSHVFVFFFWFGEYTLDSFFFLQEKYNSKIDVRVLFFQATFGGVAIPKWCDAIVLLFYFKYIKYGVNHIRTLGPLTR